MFELTGPIAQSRLEPDFYEFTMGQLIWRQYADVETTFSFKNRTPRLESATLWTSASFASTSTTHVR